MTITWSATGYPGWSFDPAYFPGHAHDYVVHQSFVVIVPTGNSLTLPRRAENEIPTPSAVVVLAIACVAAARRW